ncbi:MAG: flagellin [bacterium]
MIGVNTNTTSLMAQRHLNSTNKALQGNIAKLSSGFRINSAADDAAGLAVSEEMKSDIRSLGQASRNANDAISMVQTAEGALGQVHDILGRMRELSVQANSDGINDDQRAHVDTEFQALAAEINDISSQSQFNGTNLLDGTLNATFQVGIESTDTLSIAVSQGFSTADLEDAGGTTNLGAVDLTSTTNAATAMSVLDNAISVVSETRAGLGASQNRLESKIENLSVSRENLEAANSRIRDVDVASEMASMTKNQILMQAGASMLAQANSLPQTALSLLG